jgi:hypothetical protein
VHFISLFHAFVIHIINMGGHHRHQFHPGLVMDVRDLSTFENGTFDVAIDKGE